MGLIKLFPRWMLFSTTLTLQIAVTIAFHCGAWILRASFFFLFLKFVDANIKQNPKPLNLSIYIQ